MPAGLADELADRLMHAHRSSACRHCRRLATPAAASFSSSSASVPPRIPGSVPLPPAPPSWKMSMRVGTILRELGAMRLRLLRGVPIEIRARKMREGFVRLGPAFIKAGQALATRPDMGVPPKLCEELAKLQYEMDPFPSDEARRVISEQLGGLPLEELFSELSDEPVEAASLTPEKAEEPGEARDFLVRTARAMFMVNCVTGTTQSWRRPAWPCDVC